MSLENSDDAGQASRARWTPGVAPVAVVMISLNEEHHMNDVLRNLHGWAQEVFVVDSFSSDETVDVALKWGVHVVQRAFSGFGDQWNFSMRELPITAPWTMKLDPDERISSELKRSLEIAIAKDDAEGLTLNRRLWFLSKPLPVRQEILRVWRTGRCRFTEVAVNEHPIVEGRIRNVVGDLEHHDSPNLHHWLAKQNSYTTSEAISTYEGAKLADEPRLTGSALQRRMWLKRHFMKVPFRYLALFLYHYLVLGAWRAGWIGYAWSRLRSDVYRLWEYKLREIRITGKLPRKPPEGVGRPDPRVRQY